MSNLLKLPLELLEHIARYINKMDRQDLLTLYLVSNILRSAAQPVLFTKYSDSSLQKDYVYNNTDIGIRKSFIQFVHTVISRGDLASQVKSVDIAYTSEETIQRNSTLEGRPFKREMEILA
jgi:hypothetical protein